MKQAKGIPGEVLDPITAQRFEIKYRISDVCAQHVLAYIRPFVKRDRHAEDGAAYFVKSTYLDSPGLALYRSSVCGERNRFKLRVRTYGKNPNGHVFLEIKRRTNQVISKERATLDSSKAEAAFFCGAHDSVHPASDGHATAFHRFRGLREHLRAVPKVHVLYNREAYVSAFDEGTRVTFDRDFSCLPACNGRSAPQYAAQPPFPVLMAGVILEIKFTGRCPNWARRAIQRCGLQQQSVSKYVLALDKLQQLGVSRGLPGGVTS